ncbi:MAG: alpha/beta hydrolase [Microcoleaceae cyanobacterium]
MGALLGGGGLSCLLLAGIQGLSRHPSKGRVILTGLGALFLLLNILAYSGAYALTHFTTPEHPGLGLPRPTNLKQPSDIGLAYTTAKISVHPGEWLELWSISASVSAQGTIILFPGNGGSKGRQLLAPAQVFHQLGYDTVLVDFRGVGGSSGNTTTIGVREAEDVAQVVNFLQPTLQPPIILYGVSMGTAAILRAIAQGTIMPDGIILELPFARLLDAVRSRLRGQGLPTVLVAELMVFWGGLQHGFNGFAHNPVTDARQVNCPTLILQGKQDKWTSITEIEEIFRNLSSSKQLVVFPSAGHDLLVTTDRPLWLESVAQFLQKI